jgi:uroporphyrinogen decarboxylase
MNSFERIQTVLSGRIPDRVPVALHNYLMACQMAGGRFDQILRDGQALADAHLAAWRLFGHDLIMLENGVCAEAEAMGCTIRYSPDLPPHVEIPAIQKLEDIDRLTVPDPEKTFPLNELLKATRILIRETGGRVFINGRSDQGPVALACALCGPERFITLMMEPQHKSWVNRLLDLCSQMNVALGAAQRRAGAHSSTIGIAGASFISPALFREFEFPRIRIFCESLRREKCYSFIHACGNETAMLNEFIQTGADCLELDPRTDPAVCKQKTAGRPAVLGMLDPAAILRFGSLDQIRQHTEEILAVMGPHGGWLAGPGCALPADTPVENIQIMMDVLRQKGVYASNGTLSGGL